MGVGADCNWATDCVDSEGSPPNYQTTRLRVDLASGDVSVFAYGVRNAIGLAFDGPGRFLFTGFGSDRAAGIAGGDSDDVPDCELNLVEL